MMILVKELSWQGRETGNRAKEEHITDWVHLCTFMLWNSITIISEQKNPVYYEYTLFLQKATVKIITITTVIMDKMY